MSNKVILFTIWLVVTMVVATFICKFVSEADTLLNIIGVILIPVWIKVGVVTKCFTHINFKKDEKSN